MCNYTQVGYSCGHCRYTVRAWCIEYERTEKRCPLHVVAVEKRIDERCGDCAPANDAPWMASIQASGSLSRKTPMSSTRGWKDQHSTY